MKILICKGNLKNAKSYPDKNWEDFLILAKDHEIKEIKGILKEQEIIDLVNWSDKWISTDSFLPHLVTYHKLKPGIVLWGKSNPSIFGYSTNVNLSKGRFRPDQFRHWVNIPHEPSDFVSASDLYKSLNC